MILLHLLRTFNHTLCITSSETSLTYSNDVFDYQEQNILRKTFEVHVCVLWLDQETKIEGRIQPLEKQYRIHLLYRRQEMGCRLEVESNQIEEFRIEFYRIFQIIFHLRINRIIDFRIKSKEFRTNPASKKFDSTL